MGKSNFLENKILVIGVGGGGGNMVNHITTTNKNIDMFKSYVVNTDLQVLNKTNENKENLQIGIKTTRGLGAGMNPEVGKNSAIEDYEQLKNIVKDAEIVFISAGLGGGTGTGAAPIIAKAVRETGGISISVVTKPFKFEGRKRATIAENGYKELKKNTDIILSVSNESLLKILDKKTGIKESFKAVDEILSDSISGMINIMIEQGENDINLDFADIKTILEFKGDAFIGVGKYKSDSKNSEINVASESLKKSMSSPLLLNENIQKAKGVIINFNINTEYPLYDINEAMELLEDTIQEDTIVMFGTITNEDIPLNEVKTTIVFTGLDEVKKVDKIDNKIVEKDSSILKYINKDKLFTI